MAWLPICLAAACTSPSGGPDDTDTDTADSDEGAAWTPDRLLLVASFGYDPDQDAAVDVQAGDETLPPRLWLVVAEPGWQGDLSEPPNAFVQAWTLPSPTPAAAWAEGEVRFALDLGQGEATTHGRAVLGRDPDAVLAALAGATWGLGVHDAPDAAVATALQSRGLDPLDYAGAGLRGTVTDEAYLPAAGATEARAVDEAFVLSDTPLDRAAMLDGGGLARGWYTAEVSVAWADVAALLGLVP
ncbi:MAG: hypothetical protein H6732_08145 [Alphaproteobacteria bacterium]|nr:hypothetical protein [Alphaproteobacteria bacterium]